MATWPTMNKILGTGSRSLTLLVTQPQQLDTGWAAQGNEPGPLTAWYSVCLVPGRVLRATGA